MRLTALLVVLFGLFIDITAARFHRRAAPGICLCTVGNQEESTEHRVPMKTVTSAVCKKLSCLCKWNLTAHPEKGWNSVKLAQPVCVSAALPAELSHPGEVWDAAVSPESLKFAVQPGPGDDTKHF